MSCVRRKSSEEQTKTADQFLEDAIGHHGDQYDYSLARYNGAMSLVKIICREHGVFEQKASVHTYGSGCPQCSGKGYNENKPGRFYIIQIHDTLTGKRYVKIGITNRTVRERYWGLLRTTMIEAVLHDEYHEDGWIPRNIETRYKRTNNLNAHCTKDRGFMKGSRGYTEIYEISALPLLGLHKVKVGCAKPR